MPRLDNSGIYASSLTRLINMAFISKELKENIPKPRKLFEKRQILAEPLTTNYSQQGTAFDYLLRFTIVHKNRHVIESDLVASHVVNRRNKPTFKFTISTPFRDVAISKDINRLELYFGKRQFLKIEEHYKKYEKEIEKYKKSGKLTTNTAKACIFFANLDIIYRAGYFENKMPVLEKFKIDPLDVNDLMNLTKVIPNELTINSKYIILNPTFGKMSKRLPADGDLIIGDLLIDIKTTKECKIRSYEWNQLLGYYAFAKLGGITVGDKNKKMKINNIGIYFSRHGYLWTFNIDEYLNDNKKEWLMKFFKKYENSEKKIPKI